MGLDIVAYSRLELVHHHVPLDTDESWEDCYDRGHIRSHIIHPDFHRSARGLKLDRCYKKTPETETVEFRAGSYGGYNVARSAIWKMVTGESNEEWPEDTFERFTDTPFFEFVFFADNEGTIGPEAAIDLYGDFVAYKDQWPEYSPWDNWGLDWYDNFTKAFELASDHGMVVYC